MMREDSTMDEDEFMTEATRFATSADGTVIAFEVTGSGPALVLVDGALCSREFGPGRDVAAQLADRYTVYVYDRRGRGESGDTQPYSVEREIEDLAAVIAATGADAFVFGQSSGAALALRAAAAGVPMRKLAVYESPYVGASGRDHLAALERLLAEGRNGKAVGYFMVDMVGGPFFLPLMFRLMPKVLASLKAVAPTLPYDTRIMDGFEVRPGQFDSIAVPTLVMHGSKAKPTMKAGVAAVADAVPGSTLVVLDKQTHNVAPSALDPELSGFFR